MGVVASSLLHVANLVSGLLPQTRAFKLRALLYRGTGVSIASGARLNGGVVIQHRNVEIGSGTWVGRGTEMVSTSNAKIRIGDRCDISQGVLFIVGSHAEGGVERRAGEGISNPIVVKNGVWIGARATVLGGVTIGSGAIVGAGSLVLEDVADNVVVAGVPARVIRTLS